MKKQVTPTEIDALLPQTQCGLCGFNGCMPYAEALSANQATINLCPPGGEAGLLALGELLAINAEPYLEEMRNKAKPASRAVIREEECIGCKKCIQACPVDAILGSGKLMHTVIADECTGCELCLPPCPVDCIEMVPLEQSHTLLQKEQFRERFQNRKKRLVPNESKLDIAKEVEKKAYVAGAMARVLGKKSFKQE